jgi:pimeloyl-ACP methyl ester carboxylesterase
MMTSMQTQLLFPTGAVGPPGPLPREAMQVSVETSDGNTLHGIHIPPTSPPQKPRTVGARSLSGIGERSLSPGQASIPMASTLILGFGGNAWNGADVASYLHQIFPQADVVAFHYRGYRPSTGSPSAEALLADAPLVHDFAVNLVRPDRTIAVGFSIGSGVVASLAGHPPLDGMILVTPFDSLKTAAADLYPWLPIGPFFEHELDAAAYLKGAQVPVAMIAGEYDTLIRPARTEALRKKVPNLVYDRTIAGAGHNDIYHRPEFQQAMREALEALGK